MTLSKFYVALVALSMSLWYITTSSTSGSSAAPSMFGGRIKHVVAIMFENRSFDHMLGHLISSNPAVQGCTSEMNECQCPLDPTQSSSPMIPFGLDAVYVQPGDPSHSISGTRQQVYGPQETDNNVHTYPPPMNGFVQNYAHIDHHAADQGRVIMQGFNQTSLPILSTLAQDFALFNSWFCDVPGPTEPNRLYAWMASSQGLGNDDATRLAEGFVGPNVFRMLDDYYTYGGLNSTEKWRAYWQTFPTVAFVEYTRVHVENGHFMEEFWTDVAAGDLPLFTWLDPNYSTFPGFPPTDQHPDHNVLAGEQLMKEIYEALRASPVWNETLLLIYYDEHGGFFDHVPPAFAPNPDGINATKYGGPFDFERVGVRVPAVMISPWIPKNTVVAAPPQNAFFNASQYTHSSLIHTLREQFAPESPPLTKRDAWSATFEEVIMQLAEPRTDCPMTLPDVPTTSRMMMNAMAEKEGIHDIGKGLAYAVSALCGKEDEIDGILEMGNARAGPILMDCVRKWQTGQTVYTPKH